MNDNNVIDKDLCSGCSVCLNICPTKAILFEHNSEGFLYPRIDNNKCINCGLCRTKCPVLNPSYPNHKKPSCYAVMAPDEIRKSSTSGGVFALLADDFLKNNDYVAGAVWQENMSVKHILSNEIDVVNKMKGSKYLQSNISDCLPLLKKILDTGKRVLFSGTPCQIAGVKAYLGTDYENLYCIDIICHGVPSPAVFQKYLKEEILKKENDVWLNTNFRDKINGWGQVLTTTTTTTTTTTKGIITKEANKDLFMRAFLNDLCLRKSCSDCKFNKIPRQGDLTIGDFWAIKKYKKCLDDKKGTSIVLSNNTKGDYLLNILKQMSKITQKTPLNVGLKSNLTLYTSNSHHHNRTYFFNNLNEKTLKELIDYCVDDKCEYVIVNYWDSINYGAALTAFAMERLLTSFGVTCKTLGRDSIFPYFERYKGSFTERFANAYLNVTKVYKNDELRLLNNKIKGAVLGSDQVIAPGGLCLNSYRLLLSWLKYKRKLAISPSFAYELEEYKKASDNWLECRTVYNNIKMAFDEFDYLSCRELSGIEIYKELFGLDADLILDPVFLIEPLEYQKIIDDSNIEDLHNTIVTYVLDKDTKYYKLCDYLKIKYSGNVVSITSQDNVEDWLKKIQQCKMLVTDSFHGLCFALIFKKPFICIKNKARGVARFKCLIDLFGFEDRFVDSIDDIFNGNIGINLDFAQFENLLKDERHKCINILKKVFLEEYSNNPNSFVNTRINNISLKLDNMLYQMNKPKLLRKYYFYKILTMLTIGKTRKKYKTKRNLLHKEIFSKIYWNL